MFFKKDPKYRIEVSHEELILIRNGLLTFRNEVLRQGKPTEDIDALLLKILKVGKMI